MLYHSDWRNFNFGVKASAKGERLKKLTISLLLMNERFVHEGCLCVDTLVEECQCWWFCLEAESEWWGGGNTFWCVEFESTRLSCVCVSVYRQTRRRTFEVLMGSRTTQHRVARVQGCPPLLGPFFWEPRVPEKRCRVFAFDFC